jgi:hypothetical protein
MINFSDIRRPLLHSGLALSLSFLALAGCQSPSGTSSLGGTSAIGGNSARPGATGEMAPEAVSAQASKPAYKAMALGTLNATASVTLDGTTPSQAVDGNTDSAWASGPQDNSWLQVDCGSVNGLGGMQLKMNPGMSYDVQVSSDGQTWKTVLSNQPTRDDWQMDTKTFPDGTSGRYIKLVINNGGQNAMVFELQPQVSAVVALPSAAPSVAPPVSNAPLVATASSSASGRSPDRGVDGDTDTEWASGWVSNCWFQVDSGASTSLTGMKLKLNPGLTYSTQVSTDGKVWKTVLGNRASRSDWQMDSQVFPTGTTGRYIKLVIRNNGQNAMVFELQPQGGTPAPGPSTAPSSKPSSLPSIAPSTAPSTAPTPNPSSQPTSPPGNGTAIIVNPSTIQGRSNSHLLATCRNHVTGQFPDGAAKLQAMQQLTPQWGDRKYLYRIGHGITDGRNDYSYMTGFHFEQVWNQQNSYPYDDIRDGLQEADTMGADQMHVINFGTGDAAEAGRVVSYLNHAGDANRSQYPIAQQNVGMFELGNEISWSMERGHDQYAPDETTYARRAKVFAQSMRANSDIPIKIGAVAGTNSSWTGNNWSGGAQTVTNIINTMGNDVDFLIFHGYPSWPVVNNNSLTSIMAQNEWNKEKLDNEIWPAIKSASAGLSHPVGIANTEFFDNLYNDNTHAEGLFGAMYDADSVILAMNEKLLTAVEFCFSHSNVPDSGFFFNDTASQPTPIYGFQKMLAQHWGDNMVQSTGQNIPIQSVAGSSTNVNMPKLAYSAAASADGSKVYVMVLNRTNDTDVPTSVNVGFNPSSVTAYTMSGPSGWDSANATTATTSGVSLNNYNFNRATITILQINR